MWHSTAQLVLRARVRVSRAEASPRFFVDTTFRDKCPHRTLRKRLFQMIMRENDLNFTLDGMVADDGHNALVKRFCTPSNPSFEESLVNEVIW